MRIVDVDAARLERGEIGCRRGELKQEPKGARATDEELAQLRRMAVSDGCEAHICELLAAVDVEDAEPGH